MSEFLDADQSAGFHITAFQHSHLEVQAVVSRKRMVPSQVAFDAGGARDISENAVIAGRSFASGGPCRAAGLVSMLLFQQSSTTRVEIGAHLLQFADQIQA